MAIGIQEADVWAAADALLRAGEQPTIERVRLHLGRGSPNTVGPHLKAWFKGLGQRLQTEQGGASTHGLPEAVGQAAMQLWKQALDAAQAAWAETAAQEREALVRRQAELDAAQDALAQEKHRLAAREDDLEASVSAAREHAAVAESRLRATERQLQERDAELKTVRRQLAEATAQIASLQTRHEEEVRQLREQGHAALSQAEARHAAHERRWLQEVDEHRQARKRTQDELAELRKSSKNLAQAQLAQIEQQRQDLQAALQRAIQAEAHGQRLDDLLKVQQSAAAQAEETWQNHAARLAAQLADLQEQIHTKEQHIALLAQTVAHLSARQAAPVSPGPESAAPTVDSPLSGDDSAGKLDDTSSSTAGEGHNPP